MAVDVLTPVVDADPAYAPRRGGSRWQSAWSWLWPKALAIGLVVAVWQIVYWSHWRPDYVFPSPATTFDDRHIGCVVPIACHLNHSSGW